MSHKKKKISTKRKNITKILSDANNMRRYALQLKKEFSVFGKVTQAFIEEFGGDGINENGNKRDHTEETKKEMIDELKDYLYGLDNRYTLGISNSRDDNHKHKTETPNNFQEMINNG